jgi:hypothetical protein
MTLRLLLSTLCLLALGARAETLSKDDALKLFTDKVRPVLLESCFKCHGGEKIKGALDINTRESLLHPTDDGPVVIPGNAKASKLYKSIIRSEEPYMPAKQDRLADDKIAAIAQWIDAGAPYDKPLGNKLVVAKAHPVVTDDDRKIWSYVPLKREAPPAVKNAAWCKTPLDNFVLAKLEAKNITPNNPAEKRQLIRRAYFDLIGLPPTPEEIEAFVKDTAPNAYEKLVDTLLASPHYGERWGRHWLDLARFAESHGYEQDYDRPFAFHYRDFVIKALNEDMPYTQFVKWQLAGDELKPDDPMAMMATGFLGAGTHATQITANQVEKERYDELDDMAAVTSSTFLGLTLGCARCHDHKFDPIPQQDYYRMISTFTTTVRSELEINFDPEKTKAEKEAFDKEHAPLVAAVEKFEKEQLQGKFDAWLKAGPQRTSAPPQWVVLDFVSTKSEGGATLTRQDDGSLLASGKNPDFDTYTFVAHTNLKNITSVRLDALAHPSFPAKGGPGRAGNGNFALSDFQITAAPLPNPKADQSQLPKAVPVKLKNPRATFEQKGLPIAATIDADKKSAWAVDPQFGKDHSAAYEFETPVGFETGTQLTFTLEFKNNNGHQIGRPRLSITTNPQPLPFDANGAPQSIVELLNLVDGGKELTAEQKTAALKYYRTLDPDWQKLNAVVQEHLKKTPKPHTQKVMVCSEGVPAIRNHTQGGDFLEKTHFLKRGDVNQKQGEATQGFMQILTNTPDAEKHWQTEPPKGSKLSYRRTALANWITDVDCGAGKLLARVIVNRLWQHHLGRGIVVTPNDFGAQGEKPSHPELLDYLATELIQKGWHLKDIHKLIMTSAVYMESGDYDAQRAALDNDNALYWRRGHHRLEAEIIRDAMLAVSGTLDKTQFGPGTLDEGMKRRSIYFFVKRSKLIPLLQLFDAPNSLTSMAERASTTIAPQALAMMNSPYVQSYAKAFAQRLLPKATTSPTDAVRAGYLMAVGREPDANELADSAAFISQQAEAYKAEKKNNAMELALTNFCQALMSLNEFVFVE